MIYATLRGAGESYGDSNMCAGVVRDLNAREIAYRAEIRPIGTLTIGESEAHGRAALRSLDAEGEPWVGVAFSLGAYILGNHVMLDRPKNCKGVVLLADPLRHRSQCSNAGVSRGSWGLAGERWISGVPLHTFAIPDDPITACPGDNGLRQISDLITKRNQGIPGRWWDAWGTIEQAKKYLVDGRHVAYTGRMPGSTKTYIQAASEAVRAIR